MEMVLVALCVLVFLLLLDKLVYRRLWEKGLEVTVQFREEYAREDEITLLTETIVNDKLLPLPVLEVDFHMEKGLVFEEEENSTVSDRTYRRDVFALGPRQKITRTLPLKCVKRGYYRINASGVCGKDLLLTEKLLGTRPQSTDFFVLPRPVPSYQIAIPFAQVMGSVLAKRKLYDDPFAFAGLRGYTKTDPMKFINWKATARTGDLLVNIHETTLSRRVRVMLDMEGLGVQNADLLNEAGVRLACSLCTRLLVQGITVEVRSNGTDVLTGKPLEVSQVTGAGSTLYLEKKFACVLAGNQLPGIASFFTQEVQAGGREEPVLTLLVSRNTGEQLQEEFSAFVGKGEGLFVTPYRDSHPDLPPTSQVKRLWVEV